jgi:hypothetical protein
MVYDWQCQAKQCVVYSYGADERQSKQPQTGEASDGTPWVSVTIGGPWLLILGINSNQVVAARWQGQK